MLQPFISFARVAARNVQGTLRSAFGDGTASTRILDALLQKPFARRTSKTGGG